MRKVEQVATAVQSWITANVPAPRIGLVAPSCIDAITADFYSSLTIGIPDRQKGIYVGSIELAPDRRIDPGVIVFVDSDFKVVGATVLP